mgnify:CR=1 FL=1
MNLLLIDNTIDPDSWGAGELAGSIRQAADATIWVRRAPHDDLPDLSALRRLGVDGLFALHLGRHDLQQCLLVAVVELRRIKRRLVLADDLFRQLEHLAVHLAVLDVLERILGAADLGGRTQGSKGKALVPHLDQNGMFAAYRISARKQKRICLWRKGT